MRRRALVCAVALAALGIGGCVPPEDDSILDDYVEDRIVRQIRRAGRMTIALDDSITILGRADRGSAPSGFAVEVGTAIANELGVEAEFVPVSEEDLERISADEVEEDEVRPFEADALFVYEPMTERLIKSNTLSDPYLVSHQRLLVPADSDIDAVEDLDGRSVCQVLRPDTGVALDRLIDVRTFDGSKSTCGRDLGDSVDAVTATEVVLYDVATERGDDVRIVGEDLTTEGYGVFVEPGASGFASFVSAVIQRAIETGEWSRWSERWLADLGGEVAEPPDLSAEEAAALFPSDQPLSP